MEGIKCKQRLRVLADDQLESIHLASLSILEKTGARFDSPQAIKRLLEAGASLHPRRKGVVTFPPSLVEEAIRKVPPRATYHARDPAWDVNYDGEHMFPYAGNGDPKIIDTDTGLIRASTYADVAEAARLADALRHNHWGSGLVMANDAPPGMVVIKTMEAIMKNTVKTVSGYAPDVPTAEVLIDMWACVAGGIEELRKRPNFSMSGSPSSPLTFAEHNCDVMIRSVELGVPFTVVPCPIAGETGPITIAGSVALQNAEILAGLVLMQSVDPHLHTIYSGRVCAMDARSGRDLWGIPEEGLACVAMIQMARKYGMVGDSSGMCSDVTHFGMQMGQERALTAILPALAGAESVSGPGGGWEGGSNIDLMVIDNDFFQNLDKIMQAFPVDDECLALDLIDSVGHMGMFIGQLHTLLHFREELEGKKSAMVRSSKDASIPLLALAKKRAEEILQEHTPVPLEPDVEREVDHLVRQAAKVLGH